MEDVREIKRVLIANYPGKKNLKQQKIKGIKIFYFKKLNFKVKNKITFKKMCFTAS